jgi:hypothetical protein
MEAQSAVVSTPHVPTDLLDARQDPGGAVGHDP